MKVFGKLDFEHAEESDKKSLIEIIDDAKKKEEVETTNRDLPSVEITLGIKVTF